jgi:hypothetical protein
MSLLNFAPSLPLPVRERQEHLSFDDSAEVSSLASSPVESMHVPTQLSTPMNFDGPVASQKVVDPSTSTCALTMGKPALALFQKYLSSESQVGRSYA